MDKCLFPDCSGPVKIRGLCQSHYSTGFRLVKEGRVTWGQLEKNRKCLPAHRYQTWFLTPHQPRENRDEISPEIREEIRSVVEELCKPMSPEEHEQIRRMAAELMKPSVRKKRRAE